jgi:hypothetical protein
MGRITVHSGLTLPMYGPSTGHASVCLKEMNHHVLIGHSKWTLEVENWVRESPVAYFY